MKARPDITSSNQFTEKRLLNQITAVRAALFIADEQGRIVAQSTKWIVGGVPANRDLAPGATNLYHFVVGAEKPFITTNLTANLTVVRISLEGGKTIDVKTNVVIFAGAK